MFDYSSTELIKKKVASGLYQRTRAFDVSDIVEELKKDPFYNKFPEDQLIEYAIEKGIKDADEQTELIVSNLKKQDKFKNFTENQLYEYAYGIQNKNYMSIHSSTMHSYVDKSKPEDPIWGQYTYEEILQMEAEGVNVPEEFLDWAHGMQDANSTDYQVEEDGSDEQNTVENLDNSTTNDTQSSVQKKAQAFSSQAEAQQELIENECDEAELLAQNVADRQDELISEQKSAMQEADDDMREWTLLDEKAKNGTLTENEQRRYNELSVSLSNNNTQAFATELESLSGDIDELMAQMDKITLLIDVNDKINTELEDTSVRAAFFEGDKNRGYLGNKKDLGNFGTTDTMRATAMGGDVGKDSALRGLMLNSDNVDIKQTWETNVAIGNAAAEKLTESENLVKNAEDNNMDTNVTPRPVNNTSETENDNTTENTDTAENNNEEDVIAMAPVDIAQDSDVINTVKPEEEETVKSDETVSTENNEDNVDNQNLIRTNSSKTAEGQPAGAAANIDETTQVNTSPVEQANQEENINTAEEIDGSSNVSTEETTNVESTPVEDVQNADDTADTPDAEQDDPMKTLVSEYLSACAQKQSEMDNSGEEVTNLFRQVNEIKDSKFLDTMKLNVGFKSRIKEYEKLANKAQSGQELSSSDLARISQLEDYLDTENGEYFVSMQGKIDTLNNYTAAVDNLKQLSEANKTYGTQAVEQGKAYAVSEMGDRSNMLLLNEGNNLKSADSENADDTTSSENIVSQADTLGSNKANIIMLTKSKRYDMLYGKSGESLGRDLIDSGEALISSSSKNLKSAKNFVYKATASFASDYSAKLSSNIAEMSSAVSPLKSTIAAAIAEQNAKKEEEQQHNSNQDVQNSDSQNVNNTAVPEPEQLAQNAEQLTDETTADNVNSNDVQSRISANTKNAQRIIALNSQSAENDREITQTLLSYNSVSNTIINDDESNNNKISLNADKISIDNTSPAALKMALTTNDKSNSTSADDTSKLKTMEQRMPQLANNIETNARSVDRIVNESLQNTPVFDEGNQAEQNAYFASTAALNAAASGKVNNNSTISLSRNVKDNSNDMLRDDDSGDEAVKLAADTVKEGAKAIQKENVEEEPVEEETPIIDEEIVEDEEPETDSFMEADGLPLDINENSTENDLETVCMDKLAADSDENAEMLKDNGAKLSMEKLAKDAAEDALAENAAKGGFNASASASASLGSKLQGDNAKSETGRSRRFISYENKNRRAALADKVENSKKVVMKRGKKKSS